MEAYLIPLNVSDDDSYEPMILAPLAARLTVGAAMGAGGVAGEGAEDGGDDGADEGAVDGDIDDEVGGMDHTTIYTTRAISATPPTMSPPMCAEPPGLFDFWRRRTSDAREDFTSISIC